MIESSEAKFFDSKRQAIFLVFFVSLCLIEMLISAYGLVITDYIIRPWVLISLIIDFYSQTKQIKNAFTYGIVLALFMSLVGDSFLMIRTSDEMYFILGLAGFAFAHVFYSIAYISNIKSSRVQMSIQKRVLIIIPIVIYLLVLYTIMQKNLGDLKVPVTIYAILITMMGSTCALRLNCTEMRSYYVTLVGSVLFIFSDSLIGLNKFGGVKGKWVGPTIMVTYYSAQYLISRGAIFHIKYLQSRKQAGLVQSQDP